MSRRKRRHFSPEDKIKILRLHLLEGRPISELCAAAMPAAWIQPLTPPMRAASGMT